MYFKKTFIGLLCLLLNIHLSGQDINKTTQDDYLLTSKDLLKIKVLGHKDLDTEQRIDGSGSIAMPLIGKIKIVNIPLRKAELMIRNAYIEQRFLRNPQVSMLIEEYSPKEISALGELVKPGRIEFPIERNYIDIVEAISRAGGFTNIARSSSVVVTRVRDNREEKITIDVERIIENRSSSSNNEIYKVYPNDIIFVPKRVF